MRAWLAAFSEARDSPLLQLWRVQETRRSEGRSYWLSSPGFLCATLLAAAALSVILLRQLPVLYADMQSGGMNPLVASGIFWIAVNGSLKFGLIVLIFHCLARLFRALSDSGNLLGGGSRSQVKLDGELSASPLGNRHLIAAQHYSNIHLVLPSLAALAFLQGLHRLAGIFGSADSLPPDWFWLFCNLLLFPLCSIITSLAALLILGNIMIAIGRHGRPAPLQLGAAASSIPFQLALATGLYLIISDAQYCSTEELSTLLPALTGAIPLGWTFLCVYMATRSEPLRRIIALTFGMLPLPALYVCFLLAERLEDYSHGGTWVIVSMTHALILLQGISVLPMLSDALMQGGMFANGNILSLIVFPGLPLLSVALGQLFFLRMSFHFALSMLEQQRAQGSEANRGSPAAPRPLRRLRLARALDLGLNYLLLGLPLFLAVNVILFSVFIRAPRLSGNDEFETWLLDSLRTSEMQVAWSIPQRHYSCWAAQDFLNLNGFRSGGDWNQQTMIQLQKLARQRLLESPAGQVDPRLLALVYMGINVESYGSDRYSSYDYAETIKAQLELLEEYSPRTDDSLLLQLEAESRLMQFGQLWRYQKLPQGAKNLFSSDPKSPLYGGNWLSPEDYEQLDTLYTRAADNLAERPYPYIREVLRLLVASEFDAADRMLQRLEELPENPVELTLFAALEMQPPAGMDHTSLIILAGYDDRYMEMRGTDVVVIWDACTFYLSQGRLDSMQRLQRFWTRISGLTNFENEMTAHYVMLSAVPASVMQDPANRQFREIMRKLGIPINNGVFTGWLAYSNDTSETALLLREIENRMAYGRPNASLESWYYGRYGIGADELLYPTISPQDLLSATQARQLDWTSLSLPEGGLAAQESQTQETQSANPCNMAGQEVRE